MDTSKVAEFKQRVEKEWAGDDTATAWQKYYPQMREQLAQVTAALVAAASPREGSSILDLASGAGEPSLSLARRVAPTGKVTATDLSHGMLAALSANAKAEGVTNIDTKQCDAHGLPFPDASFDLVTSRFGVMFFAEVDRAFVEIRRVLKPGGRIAFLVWGAPAPGTYFGAAAVPYLRRLAVKPDPDGPGPMRFAEPGKLVHVVEAAGFRDVQQKSLTLGAPYPGSPELLLASIMETAAPFRNAVATLSEDDRIAAEREAYENLRPLYDGTFTNVAAPVLIVTGVS
ncbi:MAG TPA: class I SAM-dependent methyltransferase [Vicinamibacterales bacterium]|jgi:ubiquinone/menaquinone biosynthesis C-methylase UbiE|nr:class I SAM-dependent methyltransferase [Vicinamibacterales bacterium]